MKSKMKKLMGIFLVAALALSLAVAAIWDQPAQALTADEITAAQTAAATELASAQARADKAWNALQSLPTPEEVKAGAALPDTCPNCGKKTSGSGKNKLVWVVIEGEQATNISGTSGTYGGTSVHVFLTGDVTYNGESGSAFLTAPYNSGIMCVYTNGYNITSSKKPAYFGTTWKSYVIAWNRAGRNVPGSVIKGYADGDETGSTIIANPGSDLNEVHLFGGTYEKYDPASTANVIAQHGNAGKYYIYEGTTVNAGSKGSAVFLNGDMTYGRAQLNMYGGTINGGTGKAAVGVETSSQKAANASNKETFYCTFNMYAGTINGGAGQDAVKAIDESHANARGEKDCRINIYGGTINGNAEDNSIAIRMGAANSDLKIYGGTINGKAGNCAGPAIRTEVASKITIAGGTINGSTTTSSGGAIYINAAATLNINGGTIQNGIAKTGGNIYLGSGATATMTGGTISGGEARGNSAGGGNINVGSGCTLNITGGVIANGKVLYDGDGSSWGGNIRGWNARITISGGLIYGGNGAVGNIEANNIGCLGDQSGEQRPELTINGGTIVGDISTSAIQTKINAETDETEVIFPGTKVTLTGAPKIVKSLEIDGVIVTATQTGLYLPKGVEVDISGLSAEAWIVVDKPYHGQAFTAAYADAAKLTNCFTPYNEKDMIVLGEDNVFYNTGKTAAVAVVDAEGNQLCYETADAATAAYYATDGFANGAYILVNADGQTLTLAGDAYVDANGYDTVIEGTGTLYGMDRSNDDFNSAANWTVAEGVTVSAEAKFLGKRYIAVQQDGQWTFRRLAMWISSVTLRTSNPGMYYKAVFACDTVLRDAVDSYGMALSLKAMPTLDFANDSSVKCTRYDGNDFTANYNGKLVNTNSGAVVGILKTKNTKEINSENLNRKIYANAYVTFSINGGTHTVIANSDGAGLTVEDEGFTGIAYSLADTLEAVNDNWISYSLEERAMIQNFLTKWKDCISTTITPGNNGNGIELPYDDWD